MTLAAKRTTGARSGYKTFLPDRSLKVTWANIRKHRETAHPAGTLIVCVATITGTAVAQWRKVTTTAVREQYTHSAM